MFFNGWINGITTNAETGSITIDGLPFTVESDVNGGYSPISHWAYDGISFANMLIIRTEASTTTIKLQETTEGGVGSDLTEANIANDINFMFSGQYIAA